MLAAVVLLALSSARSLSRDAKRLADVRAIDSAEGLYFNDHNSYSQTLQDLVNPKYITDNMVLTAPTPPDGPCTTDQNDYHYTFKDADHFQVTFCLGKAAGGYSAGTHTMTEADIDGRSDAGSGQLWQTTPSGLPVNSSTPAN